MAALAKIERKIHIGNRWPVEPIHAVTNASGVQFSVTIPDAIAVSDMSGVAMFLYDDGYYYDVEATFSDASNGVLAEFTPIFPKNHTGHAVMQIGYSSDTVYAYTQTADMYIEEPLEPDSEATTDSV